MSEPFRLSQMFERTNRRSFLTRASAMGIGAALAACGRGEEGAERTTQGAGATTAAGGTTQHRPSVAGETHNPDSRLDTALHHPHHPTSVTPSVGGAAGVTYHRYDPTLPPLTSGRTKQIH